MNKSQEETFYNSFNILEIDFLVPNLEVADHIFAKAMKLKIYHKSKAKDMVLYDLNPITKIMCWKYEPEREEGRGIWAKHVKLCVPKKTVLSIKSYLEKDKLFAPEKRNGKTLELIKYATNEVDGKGIHVLNIFTPQIHSMLSISNKERYESSED